MNASGVKAAAKYDGVEYWLSDWQGEEMTARKYRINAEQRFYKQAERPASRARGRRPAGPAPLPRAHRPCG